LAACQYRCILATSSGVSGDATTDSASPAAETLRIAESAFAVGVGATAGTALDTVTSNSNFFVRPSLSAITVKLDRKLGVQISGSKESTLAGVCGIVAAYALTSEATRRVLFRDGSL
jgi:hypothetical protein